MGEKFQLLISNALSGSRSGSGIIDRVMKAVENCVNQGAKVVSLSLGGGSSSTVLQKFYQDYTNNDDISFVAAAVNFGSS